MSAAHQRMLPDVAAPANSSESCSPAPYGGACEGCARAKCKCFYRTPPESGCERCHRRGIDCKPSPSSRKRKHGTQHIPAPAHNATSISTVGSAPVTALASSFVGTPPSSRVKASLDDLFSLLRSQVSEKQIPHPAPASRATAVRDPDVVLDMMTSAVRLVRPNDPSPTSSPILEDVLSWDISETLAEEQLDTFRSAFLPMFPFVHLPFTISASQLRYQQPFLWSVIICLTTKSVSQQFAISEQIWGIISRRIVSEHLADLDLLLGVLCFASWSHYFKKDKPFMNMLTQLALSLATELGLHKDVTTKPSGALAQNGSGQKIRSLEERRTMLAVFHLTSSTWAAYRKIEPLRWSQYLDDCLRVLSEVGETMMDGLLVAQIKCQLITHQVAVPCTEETWEDGPKSTSPIIATALRERLEELYRSLPAHVRSERTTQFYINNAMLTIQASGIGRPTPQDHANLAGLRELQDAEATLGTIVSWLVLFFDMPFSSWVGMSVDIFAQFTHCIVVLFKLTTMERPGWDPKEVKRRANVFDILDRAAEIVDRVPAALGIVDAEGSRRGLLFKTAFLLRAIRKLLLREMGLENQQQQQHQQQQQQQATSANTLDGGVGSGDDLYISDEVLMSLWDEPWLSDMMMPF